VQPVWVRRLPQRHEVQVTGVETLRDDTAEDTQPTTIIEKLQWFCSQNPKEARILDELVLVGDHSVIIRSINDGMACAISDGSFKDKSGAAAFTIKSPKTKAAYTETRRNIHCRACRRLAVPTVVNCWVYLASLLWQTCYAYTTELTRVV
jgi:hypothetical protein